MQCLALLSFYSPFSFRFSLTSPSLPPARLVFQKFIRTHSKNPLQAHTHTHMYKHTKTKRKNKKFPNSTRFPSPFPFPFPFSPFPYFCSCSYRRSFFPFPFTENTDNTNRQGTCFTLDTPSSTLVGPGWLTCVCTVQYMHRVPTYLQ